MINLATKLFILFFLFYHYSLLKLFLSKKERNKHRTTQEKLKNLRKKPMKTLEEQKQFINIKYPKSKPFKWSFKNIIKNIFFISINVFIILSSFNIWDKYINFIFTLWEFFLISVFYPILINIILKKFNLQRDDIRVFFR